MKLNKKLKELRKDHSYSLEDVAQRIDIPVSTYRDYEYGSRLPADLLPRLCNLYQISVSEMFDLKSNYKFSKEQCKNVISDIESSLQQLKDILYKV